MGLCQKVSEGGRKRPEETVHWLTGHIVLAGGPEFGSQNPLQTAHGSL